MLKDLICIITILLCSVVPLGAQAEPAPEPQELLDGAVEHLQAAESFRMAIEHMGAPYPLALTLDGVNIIPATMESADVQFINPDELYISTVIHLLIPFSMDIYSRDDRQWISFPSGAPWFLLPAFEDFDVKRLMAAGDGMDYALSNLIEPQIVDDEAQVDEQSAWQIQATAAGDVVEGLLFGLIDPQDDVEISAYITVEDGKLALIEITMLETITEDEDDPAVWHITFFDYDAPRDFDPPE